MKEADPWDDEIAAFRIAYERMERDYMQQLGTETIALLARSEHRHATVMLGMHEGQPRALLVRTTFAFGDFVVGADAVTHLLVKCGIPSSATPSIAEMVTVGEAQPRVVRTDYSQSELEAMLAAPDAQATMVGLVLRLQLELQKTQSELRAQQLGRPPDVG